MEKDATTITLGVGESFVVRFEGQAATGFEWQSSCNQPDILSLEKRYLPPVRGAPFGKSVQVEFLLKALATGTAQVRFFLKRSWEKATPRQEKLVTVLIR